MTIKGSKPRTYWMFAVWLNSRGVGESARFHVDLPFDPRTLEGREGEIFVAQMLTLAGIRADELANRGTEPCVKIEIYDSEAACVARYKAVRKQLGITATGRDPMAGVGRYGQG